MVKIIEKLGLGEHPVGGNKGVITIEESSTNYNNAKWDVWWTSHGESHYPLRAYWSSALKVGFDRSGKGVSWFKSALSMWMMRKKKIRTMFSGELFSCSDTHIGIG